MAEQAAELLSRLQLDRFRWEFEPLLQQVTLWVPYVPAGPADAIAALQREAYQPWYTARSEPEPGDFERAHLFGLAGGANVRLPDGPRIDWDLSRMCAVCGAGAEPVGGMRLGRSRMPKKPDVGWTWQAEYHFSTRLKNLFESEFGPLPDFRQDTESRRRDVPLPWWYLYPVHVLLPLSEKSRNIRKICNNCPNGGFVGVGLEHPTFLVYEFTGEQADSLPLFARSFEYWGESQLVEDEIHRIVYSRQSIYVNRACREFLIRHRIKNVEFYPMDTRIIE